jgi:hypothetical protein
MTAPAAAERAARRASPGNQLGNSKLAGGEGGAAQPGTRWRLRAGGTIMAAGPRRGRAGRLAGR